MRMTPQNTVAQIYDFTLIANQTKRDFQIYPIISTQATSIISFVFSTFLGSLTGVLGILTNVANISVYLKIGLTEKTNISFFSLSIFDLFVSTSTIVVLISYSRLVSAIKLPSGAPVAEIGIGATLILYPCLGCSAWITAILSTERCLCIAMPLKVMFQVCRVLGSC